MEEKKNTNHHLVTDDEISRFNLTRENLKNKKFNNEEIRNELNKKMGYTKAWALLRALCEGPNPPVIKQERGVYVFNTKPVYKERLQTCWDLYTKYVNPQNYKNGKYEKTSTLSIEEAIEVLKKAGYKILKPVTQYEEI